MSYAKCSDCGREMMPGVACKFTHLVMKNGNVIKRDTQGFGHTICHDCNAPLGGAHHSGCDEERCPICGGQFISCDCFGTSIELVYYNIINTKGEENAKMG